MASPGTLTRIFDEFLWVLRRVGIAISTSQVLDVMRAVALAGLEERTRVRDAIASVVVTRAQDRHIYDRAFDSFFHEGPRQSLWERLNNLGFDASEIEEIRQWIEFNFELQEGEEGTLFDGGSSLDYRFERAGVRHSVNALQNPLQSGFLVHAALRQIGTHALRSKLALMHARLREIWGTERGLVLIDALREQLDLAEMTVRQTLEERLNNRMMQYTRPGIETNPFASLTSEQILEMRRQVRLFAEKLRGSARIRLRHAKTGRIDPGRTFRKALKTLGVPLVPVYRARRRRKPVLVILCDVSDSVRVASTFMLEFVAATHQLFERTRSFVFVSEIAEATKLFKSETPDIALQKALSGALVSLAQNSNYGRALRTFQSKFMLSIDRNTTVVILGDGRTNFFESSSSILSELRQRARALYWFCTEPRSHWGIGDSAMQKYAPECSRVFEVQCTQDLEKVARMLVKER